MTLRDARRLLNRRLAGAGIDSPEIEATRLLEALTGLGPSDQVLHATRRLTPAESDTLESWIRRREAREPLQHIVGTTGFYGLELVVGPAALIPRPETELLVEFALRALPAAGAAPPRVLDVGTGSGAIALALKRERPDVEVLATDVAAQALDLARHNARRLGLALRFVRSDLLDHPEVADFARTADLLVSNPPYLPDADRLAAPPELAHDPALALYAGERGLDLYLRLERQARALLRPGALMLVELDPRNIDEAHRRAEGWAARAIERDLVGRRRFLRLER